MKGVKNMTAYTIEDLQTEILTNFWDETVTIEEQPDGTVKATYPDENGEETTRIYYHTDFDTVTERWYRKGWIY